MGRILRVNLTDGTITEEFPDDDVLRKYLGGAGLATWYLINETEAGIDPLGPENKLIFIYTKPIEFSKFSFFRLVTSKLSHFKLGKTSKFV